MPRSARAWPVAAKWVAAWSVAAWLLAGLTMAAEPTAPMGPPWPETGLAAGQDKFLGNVLRARMDPGFHDYWNQVTPEDAGKWLSVEAVRGTMVWSVLDLFYDYARARGLPVKQHAFVWGQQEPRWVAGLPPEEQREAVDEWMRLFAERYPDTAFVDVVNEPVHAPPPTPRPWAATARPAGTGSSGPSSAPGSTCPTPSC